MVGIADPEWGETVAAAVVVEGGDADPGVVAEELAAWVHRHLGTFKTPARIVVVEELPATATGKLLRREVRDRLAGPVSP